eukprot:scaffold23089_cov78-Skeletonema_dohrnii-CCMP3373.AAC.1
MMQFCALTMTALASATVLDGSTSMIVSVVVIFVERRQTKRFERSAKNPKSTILHSHSKNQSIDIDERTLNVAWAGPRLLEEASYWRQQTIAQTKITGVNSHWIAAAGQYNCD